MVAAQDGVVMELQDSALPLLTGEFFFLTVMEGRREGGWEGGRERGREQFLPFSIAYLKVFLLLCFKFIKCTCKLYPGNKNF